MARLFKKTALVLLSGVLLASASFGESAYRINGNDVSVADLYKENQDRFYELEKQKFELIERIAHQQYLDTFFEDLAKKEKTTAEEAREQYLVSKAKLNDSDIKATIEKFKDHPQLKELSDTEKKKQITDYLKSVKTREVIDELIQGAIASKKLVVSYPKPKEPIYKLTVTENDPVKFGPKPTDTKPIGCKGNDCPLTVVEYSEFQCPFCTKVLPTVKRLMAEYKGKVRWIVRDFPLGFHKRARPAAAAAHCAKRQGKFWQMYDQLFANQRSLEDTDFKKYAKKIKLDSKKFEKCLKDPKIMAAVEKNYRSGEKLGVTGTPAFFINGRRLSGALPYSEFKKIFDEEIESKNAG